MNNQRGALTVDFLFALIILMSTMMVFTIFSFTLSIFENIQYVAFASSRAYFAGHETKENQENYGKAKFEDLRNKKLQGLLKPGWFDIDNKFGDFKSVYGSSNERDVFIGSRMKVVAKILGFSTPMLGTTGDDTEYQAYVTSFLGREPSSQECRQFWSMRWDAIKQLEGGNYSQVPSQGDLETSDDNGC